MRMLLIAAALVLTAVGLVIWLADELHPADAAKPTKDRRLRTVEPAKVKAPRPAKPKPKTVNDALDNLGELPQVAVEPSPNAVDLSRYNRRVFKSGTEQLMSWVFTTTPGDLPMPIPELSKEERSELAAVLISKNPIEEGDSDTVRECKEVVSLAKKEMIKFIKEGGDPDEFLQHYYRELENAFQYRSEAQRQADQLLEEDPNMAAEFVKKVNEKLGENGIMPIPEIDISDSITEEVQ